MENSIGIMYRGGVLHVELLICNTHVLETSETHLTDRESKCVEGEETSRIGDRPREDNLNGGIGCVTQQTTVIVQEGFVDEERGSIA